MPDALAIETAALQKSYGDIAALRRLDLQVPCGSIYGFIGRNGAGKTTAIKVLLGMVKPTGGSAHVFGLNAANAKASVAIRTRTAFVSEDKDLIESMAVDEIVRFTASFYSGWRADLAQRYLQKFELPQSRTVKALSKGMRTKLALMLALSRGAALLILDEPTSGLDPAVAEEVLQALVGYTATEGATVFFSSHQIAEIEQIADRVTMIDAGRAVVSGKIEELRENYCRVQLVFPGEAPTAFSPPGVVRTQRQGRALSLLVSSGADRVIAEARTLNPVSVDVTPVLLKDIFLETVAKED